MQQFRLHVVSVSYTHLDVYKRQALVSPYLIVIKDCRLINKKKRMLFDNPELPELMISSIINMRSYPSSTIVSERFLCFKNFANNFPNIMAKNINHWFEVFVLNVCSMASPFSPKTLEIGTNCCLLYTSRCV